MITTHDGKPMIEKPRKYSINLTTEMEEIEKITFPPSTELIPDEYKHEDNKMGLVYIFYSSADTESMELLKQALNDQDYEVPPENTIKIIKREVVLNALQRIASEDNSDKTCLMVFILGHSIGDDLILPEGELNDWKNCVMVKDVWINFTGDNCDSLRNKPKLFIFQGSLKPQITQVDSLPKQTNNIKTRYGFPAEADMMVVYNKVEFSRRTNFIEHFCNNLDEYGKEDDVIGIVTRVEQPYDQRPLIISTFTRKFFISPNSNRGHHYEYNLNYDSLVDMVEALNIKVDCVIDYISNSIRTSSQKSSPNDSTHVVDGRVRRTPASTISRGNSNLTGSTKSAKSTAKTVVVPQRERWRF